MKSSNKNPKIPAGITPTITFNHKSIVFFFCCLDLFELKGFSFSKYNTTTDRIAPSWIITLKLFEKDCGFRETNSFTKIRCPVLLTGRNSVTPSTILKINTLIMSNIQKSS